MNIQKIGAVIGIMAALGLVPLINWIWDYHDKFVTVEVTEKEKEKEKRKESLKNLDNSKEHVKTRITIFQLHGLANLTDEQREDYNRVSARLISLQARRDAITSGSND